MISLLMLAFIAAAQDGASSLRVLTYNIHHAEGRDGNVDLERIAAVIRDVNPDVVCLQEVDRNLPRTQHVDMPAQLASLLDMQVVFGPNYHFDGGDYGNATLTHLPILRHENFPLPGPENTEPRGCLRVDLKLRDKEISVFNTHWGLEPEERAEQARATVDLMRGHDVAMLAGDLNAVPASEPLNIVGSHLRDSATAAPPGSSLDTVRNRRIDYILYSPNLIPTQVEVVRTDTALQASDHLPYWAELTLAP